MSTFRSLPLILAAMVVVGCASQDESEPAAADDASQALACWLRQGTMDEAAERVSPLRETTFTLGGEEAKLCYGAPSARGRTVFGELEAFGVPWRSGANEATALHLPVAAMVGDIDLEAGSYSIYTVPGEDEWGVVVNGTAERWGIPISEEVRAADIGSFTVPRESTQMVETLTWAWEPEGEDSGHLVLLWETTRVPIPIRRGEM
jgi:hypothetical protein